MDIQSKFFLPILGFMLTLVFGFWLSRKGKPYPGLLFNIHKLIALGTVILGAVGVYRILQDMDPGALVILFLVLVVVSIIGLFASGALMSAGKGEYRVMKLIHNFAPILGVVAMAGAAYLIL